MRRSLSLVALVLTAVLAAAPAFGQSPSLEGQMEALKIVLDENNREIAVSAEKVYPSDVLEYRLVYSNSGNAAASGINLTGPIPEGTVYLDETATAAKGMHPVFSIDGGESYMEAPVTYVVVNEDGEEEVKGATPDMITHVRWRVDTVLDVGQELVVSYRVQVR